MMVLKSEQKQKEIRQKYYSLNGNVYSTNEFNPDYITSKKSVYEVIRIQAGIPLFLEEHLIRLKNSINLLGYQYSFSDLHVKQQIHKLIHINQCYDLNVKIVVNELHSGSPNLFLYFISSTYPTAEDYKYGVHTTLYFAERQNPNIKAVAHSFREQINQVIKEAQCYEAILVNKNNEITEGSRSNIFLVKENKFYTAPSKDVLVGITRSRIMNLCDHLAIPVIEMSIPVTFLDEIDGLFMTGTSPKVLPIASVDQKKYNSADNILVQQIQRAYDKLIEDYIHAYKKPE